MRASHAVAGIAGAIVAAGVGLAWLARLLSGGAALAGPIPAEALAFPANTRLLAGLDLARLRDSPVYERYEPLLARAGQMAPLGSLARLGLDPLRDLDHVVVALLPGDGDETAVLALLRGRLDRVAGRLDDAGLASRVMPGARSWTLGGGNGGAAVLALLGTGSALLGSLAAVESTARRLERGDTPLREDRALGELAAELPAGGGSFWLIGDHALLAELTAALGSGTGGLGMALPPLDGVAVSAEPAAQLAVDIVARARDEAGARRLADTLRGLLALASLQAARAPELGRAASAISVTTDARRVRVGAQLPPELLESLARFAGRGAAGASGGAQ